jgi:hypothetical protein
MAPRGHATLYIYIYIYILVWKGEWQSWIRHSFFFLYIKESYQQSLTNVRTNRPQIVLKVFTSFRPLEERYELQNFISLQTNIMSKVLTFILGNPVQVSWVLLSWWNDILSWMLPHSCQKTVSLLLVSQNNMHEATWKRQLQQRYHPSDLGQEDTDNIHTYAHTPTGVNTRWEFNAHTYV